MKKSCSNNYKREEIFKGILKHFVILNLHCKESAKKEIKEKIYDIFYDQDIKLRRLKFERGKYSDDENLIDKNIYKYLDCKKLLDTILEKFQGETKNLLNIFKDRLSSLQNEISLSISPVKKSFEMIIKSKNSKEIIHKFEKYFLMKDEIENFLKFSSFEDLADYLKKSDEIRFKS